MITPDIERRFWVKVDRSGGCDACWPWMGDNSRQGYGKIRIHYRRWLAHRVSLMIATGENPPPTTYALHSCDNPACVNPKHLRWGTAKDNTADRLARTHRIGMCAVHGERNGRAVLTAEQADAIRNDPRPSPAVARDFCVSGSTVKRIRAGKAWTHEQKKEAA